MNVYEQVLKRQRRREFWRALDEAVPALFGFLGLAALATLFLVTKF